jgi:hypothetical protein
MAIPNTNVKQKIMIYGQDGINPVPVLTDAAGNLQVEVVTSALGAGGATEAKQDTIISKQTDIITALGNLVPASPIKIKDSLVNDDGSEVVLGGLVADAWYGLARMHVVRTGGSAANYRPRLYDTTAGVAGAISDIQYTDLTVVTTVIDDVFVSYIPFQADSAGRIYFVSGVDAGADNGIDYNITLFYLGA